MVHELLNTVYVRYHPQKKKKHGGPSQQLPPTTSDTVQVTGWIAWMMQILLEGLSDVLHAQNGINLRDIVFMYVPLVKGQELPR